MIHGQQNIKKSTYQLLFHADDVNILVVKEHNVKKNTKALVITTEGTGVEVNADRVSTWSC
jgi:DNA-binding transcriptional regulator WhiA